MINYLYAFFLNGLWLTSLLNFFTGITSKIQKRKVRCNEYSGLFNKPDKCQFHYKWNNNKMTPLASNIYNKHNNIIRHRRWRTHQLKNLISTFVRYLWHRYFIRKLFYKYGIPTGFFSNNY